MKKNYFKSFLGALCLLSVSGASAQTYVSGDISASAMPVMNHDTMTCSSTCSLMYMVTISSSFAGDSLKVVDTASGMLLFSAGNTAGTTPWLVTVPVPIFNPVVTDDQLAGGMAMFMGPVVKFVSGPDTAFAPNMYPFMVPDPCVYGSVSGKVYVDNNSDCIFNSGDVGLNAIPITSTATLFSPSMASIGASAYSGATGTYTMTVQKSWMSSYNVTVPPYYYFIFPPTSCFSGAYAYTTLPQVNVDFPVQCTSNVDVQAGAGAPAAARPLHAFYMHPFVSNTGCDTASGVLTFIKDSRVTYNASLSTNPAISVSGDTLRWNYSHLTNLSGSGYWNSFLSSIHLTPNSTVSVGDTLCFSGYANVPTGDVNTANNSFALCIPVVNSYDPNIKEVSPKGAGTPGYIPASTPTLSYTIHFQNTGTASAINISVIDTLDTDLDLNTLRVLGTSHAMQPEWLAPKVVKFNFVNIFLPDSTSNEPASHGFIKFNINPKSGLAPGTQIKNTAYIYFDSNPAVITNTALNTIAIPTALDESVSTDGVGVYPNPASTSIYLQNVLNCKVSVIDMKGSVLIERESNSSDLQLNIASLSPGVYLVRCVGNAGTTVNRFTKL